MGPGRGRGRRLDQLASGLDEQPVMDNHRQQTPPPGIDEGLMGAPPGAFLSDLADSLSDGSASRGAEGPHADGPPPSGPGTEGAARRSTALEGPSPRNVGQTADRTRAGREPGRRAASESAASRAAGLRPVGTTA